MKLTENDLKSTLEVIENSDVCFGVLREPSGAANAYCVIGALVAGTARNRHKSFKTIRNAMGANISNGDHLGNMLGGYFEEKKMKSLDINPVRKNDDFEYIQSAKSKLKRWQQGYVRRLLKFVQNHGPLDLDEIRGNP